MNTLVRDASGHYRVSGRLSEEEILREAQRIIERRFQCRHVLPRPDEAKAFVIAKLALSLNEVFAAIFLDNRHRVMAFETLFTGTIESNLLYADETATPDMLQDAVDIAQAAEFVSTSPSGLETEVAQGGTNVSGGQRQRLSIARALVKKPPIYIFDDSFSALDFKTDAALRKALREKTGASTVLIVTQRVSTIMHAEQIIVLDEGRIVGKGTHSELLTTCEVYREIAMSQLNMEELAS